MPRQWSLRHSVRGGVGVVTASGELDLVTAPELRAEIAAAARKSAGTVVIDLAALDFCDVSGMRALLGARAALAAAGHRLLVVAPRQGAAGRMLELVQADQELDLYVVRGEALEAAASG